MGNQKGGDFHKAGRGFIRPSSARSHRGWDGERRKSANEKHARCQNLAAGKIERCRTVIAVLIKSGGRFKVFHGSSSLLCCDCATCLRGKRYTGLRWSALDS